MIASFLEAYTAPKREIPRRVYLTVSTLVGLCSLLAWCTLSYGGLVRSDFLPTPSPSSRRASTWPGTARSS